MYFDPQSVVSYIRFMFIVIYWITIIFISLYVPGRLVFRSTRKNSLGFVELTTLSLIIGLALWTIQALVFGWLGVRFLTYVYLVTVMIMVRNEAIGWVRQLITESWNLIRHHPWVTVLFLAGISIQMSQAFSSGFIFPDGWRTYISDDSLWHMSVTGELVRAFPPDWPGLSGVRFTNYHFLGNLVTAEFIRVFGIPFLLTQYLLVYILLSSLLGLASYSLMRVLGFSVRAALLAPLIQYTATDLIWLMSKFTTGDFVFTVHPLEDATMLIENPPRAFSFVLFLGATSLFVLWTKSRSVAAGIAASVLYGLIIGFKVHTGIMALGGLVVYGCALLLWRQWKFLYVPVLAGVVALVVYVPFNSGAGLPIYAPFEIARMFSAQEPLRIVFLELRRQTYAAHNNFLRVLQMELTMLGVFMIAQFGVRNLGWFGLPRLYRISRETSIVTGGALFVTLIFGSLFIQPLTFADIFNSYNAASLVLGVLLVVWLGSYIRIKTHRRYVLFIMILVAIAIPRLAYRQVKLFSDFSRPGTAISGDEFEVARFIRNNAPKDAVLLVYNDGKMDSMYAYFGALAQRSTYFSGQGMLRRNGVSFAGRQLLVTRAMSDFSHTDFKLLSHSPVTYIVMYGGHDITDNAVEQVYRIGDISVFRIK